MTILSEKIHYLSVNNNGLRIELRSLKSFILNKFDKKSENYYVVEIGNKASIIYLIENKSLLFGLDGWESIKSGYANLIIDCCMEPDDGSIETIYKILVSQEKISPSNIIFITGSIQKDYKTKETASRYNTEPITVISYQWWKEFVQWLQKKESQISDNVPDYTFLSFNRRLRPHRVAFINLLYQNNLLSFGKVSASKNDDCENDFAYQTKKLKHAWPKIYSQIPSTSLSELYNNILPLYVDVNINDIDNNLAGILDETEVYYQNTLLSVVMETCQNYDDWFFSEKTWKPILYKHPFILFNKEFSLQKLREFGYKTFDNVIDETYDTIVNHEDRLLAIVEELKRLCNLTYQEKVSFKENVKEIVEFNYQKFIRDKKFLY